MTRLDAKGVEEWPRLSMPFSRLSSWCDPPHSDPSSSLSSNSLFFFALLCLFGVNLYSGCAAWWLSLSMAAYFSYNSRISFGSIGQLAPDTCDTTWWLFSLQYCLTRSAYAER